MISVALASYNGEKYIEKQIRSILENIGEKDELIISDDGSSDKTKEIIQKIDDSRIQVFSGNHRGINQNFANAIRHCKGDYIFLSDQDDVWYPGKVKTVINAFQNGNYLLVQHDAKVTDEEGNVIIESFSTHRRVRTGFVKNYIRNTYHGCCMAFSAKIKDYILPIPNKGCFHDYWIGLIANLKGNTLFIDDVLMEYKRYGGNASSFEQYPRLIQLKNRLFIAINLLLYCFNSNKRI